MQLDFTMAKNIKETEIITLIDLFSTDEFEAFCKWLGVKNIEASAKSDKLHHLLLCMRNRQTNETTETIREKIYANEPDKDKIAFNKLWSKLHAQVENFIIYHKIEQNKIEKERILLEILIEKKAEKKLIEHQLKQWAKAINQHHAQDLAYYKAKIKMLEYHLEYDILFSIKIKVDRADLLKTKEIALTIEYLKEGCIFLTNKEKGISIFQRETLRKWVADIKNIAHLAENDLINIYLQLYDLLRQDIAMTTTDDLQKIVEILKREAQKKERILLSMSEIINIYRAMLNKAIALIKYHKKAEKYLVYLASLYELGLDNELLYVNGIIPAKDYRNIVLCWIDLQYPIGYIEHKISKLQLPDNKEIIYLMKAIFHFEKREYQEMISMITKASVSLSIDYYRYQLLLLEKKAKITIYTPKTDIASVAKSCSDYAKQLRNAENSHIYRVEALIHEFELLAALAKKQREKVLEKSKIAEEQKFFFITHKWWEAQLAEYQNP